MDKINYLFRDYIRSYEIQHITKDPKNLHFERIGTFGESQLDGWTNKLILGDNLLALELLLQDPTISGQVRLIYIDPPYSTSKDFRSGLLNLLQLSFLFRRRVAF
jgi:16S rRNA G966 N2-methylase RsmD